MTIEIYIPRIDRKIIECSAEEDQQILDYLKKYGKPTSVELGEYYIEWYDEDKDKPPPEPPAALKQLIEQEKGSLHYIVRKHVYPRKL